MVAPKDKMGAAIEPSQEIEHCPDAWERFERAVDAAVKSGPKHRITPKAKERPASKGRVHKGKTRV
jgi:hypothetical protein